jgi:hypothetical protein
MKKVCVFSFLLLFCFPLMVTSAMAAPVKINTGSVNFVATGKPGFLKINGTGPDITGDLDSSAQGLTGTVTVAMEKFTSGIELRDEHMKEKYLEVKKFPVATLKIREMSFNPSAANQEQAFKGVLNFHGVEKNVDGVAKVANANGKLTIDANFPITISDFKIEVPSYAGIKVADTVEVKAVVSALLPK